MFDFLDFEWIDFDEKIIYKDNLIMTIKKSYNKEFDGKLPPIREFTYQ